MSILVRLLLLFMIVTPLASSCATSPAQTARAELCHGLSPQQLEPVVLKVQLPRAVTSPVVTLDFAANHEHLAAVYASVNSESGQVVTWNISNKEVIQQRTIDWIHPHLTSMSAKGNMLATVDDRPHMVERQRSGFNFPEDIVEFVNIWNMDSGQQPVLLPHYGPGRRGFTIREVYVSLDGRQLLTIFELGAALDSTDPTSGQGGQSIYRPISSEDPDFVPDAFVVGGFGPRGKSFALGFESGVVWLQKLTGDLYSEAAGALSPQTVRGDKKINALAFDMTGNWLAILRTHSVELRNLRSWFATIWPSLIKYDLPAAETGKVAFSPRNTVLAIGTPQGWQLRRTSDLSLVAEQKERPVTSLAFSDDGCLVAFGTADGTIEIWSVPEP